MATKIDQTNLQLPGVYGMIADVVAPKIRVGTPSGTFYFADIVDRAAAQTNRSAGTAPSAVVIAEGSVAYTATELVKRYVLPAEKIALFGGQDNAIQLGARAAIQMVKEAHEKNVAAAIFGSTTNAVIDATADTDFAALIETAKYAVELGAGKTVMVCGSDALRTILSLSDISALLSTMGAITPAQRFSADTLAALLGLDAVIVGSKRFWGANGTTDFSKYCAVLQLPEPSAEAALVSPQSVRSLTNWGPDGEFDLSYFEDDDVHGIKVDALAKVVVKVLNGEAIQVINNISLT
jgi:hypothetical protein